jgi:hypothetical protein
MVVVTILQPGDAVGDAEAVAVGEADGLPVAV